VCKTTALILIISDGIGINVLLVWRRCSSLENICQQPSYTIA